ncbi:MAG TPA: uL15 family ribosomal protein [Candidatus Paceibacterota bacterium]|nr:uL15 family ribosomal protein [Candidatus Paceibacterota bacterium]
MISLQRKVKNKKAKLVGRGSKRGKTSGRGTKGQKARAGHRIRPAIRDMIKKYPKLRGRGKNSNKAFRPTPAIVNVGSLAAAFAPQSMVTPSQLLAKGLIRRKKGILPAVKIVGGGTIDHPLALYDCTATDAAKEKIVAAGGVLN